MRVPLLQRLTLCRRAEITGRPCLHPTITAAGRSQGTRIVTPEFPITKSHLQGQRVVRRRGRPSKFGRGLRTMEIPISDNTRVALEMLASYEQPKLARSNRDSARSCEYARDALEQLICDRFEQVFEMSLGEFLRRTEPLT